MKKPIFTGAGVAIITPFTSDGKVNYPALKEIERLRGGSAVKGILVYQPPGRASQVAAFIEVFDVFPEAQKLHFARQVQTFHLLSGAAQQVSVSS